MGVASAAGEASLGKLMRRWHRKFGGMDVNEAKRSRQLEDEVVTYLRKCGSSPPRLSGLRPKRSSSFALRQAGGHWVSLHIASNVDRARARSFGTPRPRSWTSAHE